MILCTLIDLWNIFSENIYTRINNATWSQIIRRPKCGKKIYIPQYTHLLSFLLWLLFLQLIKQSTSEKSVPIFLINFGDTYMIKMHSPINVWRFVGTNIRYLYALLRWRHIPAQTIYFLPSSEMVEWFFRLWTFCNE